MTMYTLYALYFAIFAILASVLYLICGRIVARLLEWFARRLFKVEIQVERAQFLALGSIKITTAGTRIEIENIVLQTKWGFPGSRRFFMLCFGHITVTAAKNGARVKDFKDVSEEKKPNPNRGNDVSRNQRLAGIVKFISKYMGIYLHSLDVILTNQPRSKFNIIVQVVKGINIVCQPNERLLDFSVRATKCVSSLHQAKEIETDYFQDVTLAEVSLNILLEGSLNPVMSEQILEDLSIKVNPIRISLGDNLIKNLPQLHDTSKKLHSLTATGEESKSTKLSKYLPKNFDLIFTEVDLFVCDEEQRELSIHTNNLSFTASLQDKSWWMIKTMLLLINGLKVKARSSKDLMSFSKFMLDIKTQKSESDLPSLLSNISLASCQCNYVHDEISHWLALLPLEKREIGSGEKQSFLTTLAKLTKEYSFENNLEVDDMTVCLSENLSNGQDKPVCKAVLASLVTNIQLPAQDLLQTTETVNCSARLENAYVYFNVTDAETVGIWLEDNPSVLPSSRKHLWGRVLELGSSSIKCDIELEDSTASKVVMKCDASSLVFEYSQHTKNCLATLLQTGEMYKRLQTRKSGIETEQSSNNIMCLECDVTVHDINMFCVGKCQDGVDSVLARLDVVSVTKGEDDVQIGAHGCKVTRLTEVKKEAYGCATSSDMHHSLLTVTSAVTRLSSKGTTLSLPNIKVDWDIASHMAVHDRISRIIGDSKELKAILADSTKDSEVTDDFISNVQLEITTEDVAIEMKTSSVNSFGVQFSGVIKLDEGWIAAESPNIDILFDEKTIFQFKAFSLKKTANNSDASSVRNTMEGFESNTNKIWLLDAEIYILFPYRFDFGKSLDKLLIVNKMLKQLYRKPSIGMKDPLYADLWLNLKKLSFEIEDDPFEVKLGKNYELLCDEALEWTAREILLDERISEKKKNPGNMLSDKKVDNLYESLREKKSKIYIERSVKLYEADKRTRLCCWEFSDVNLMILADESMNGPDKVVPAMKRIDNESPFPSEDIQFSTLWSRFIKGTVSSSTFTLRDYEQPLFLCESFEISGRLIGAEQAACERAKRTCVVEIPPPWGDQEVSRGMTPLKYFHDLSFDFQKLEMSWGVDIEPAYAMVNIAFEHINKASVDPSVSLPFWDKMRLLLHGRLSMNIKEWQLNWRATRNPYDKSEQLEIEWRNVRFDWTNACFEIFGDFDLFTRTASKYDDCCVLHLPALKFRADLVWHCRDEGDANNHYNIRPCAPNKLPQLPPGQVHDSYAAFRSQNLSLNISFEVDAKRLKEDDVPTILLYASTFRWFQNFQAAVWRNVSRPIKKGSIFNRILPKRKPLSRHYRNVGFNLKFPQLSVFYWGSVTKHLGAELNLGTGSLNTVYRVGLSEYKDGLVRRPAATWTIIKLDSEIEDVTCYVTCVEEKEPEKEPGNESDEQSAPNQESSGPDKDVFEPKTLEPSKFYLGHVDRLVYKRKELNTFEEQTEIDGTMSDNLEDYTHNLVCHNFRGVWTLTNRKLSFGLVETYTRSQQLKRDLSADALKFAKVDNKTTVVPEASPDVSTRKDSSTRRLSTSQTKLDDLFTKTIGGKMEGGDDADVPGSRPRSITSDILLDKLVSESADSSKFYVQTEEGTTDETQSGGYALCNSEDVHEQRWHFEFVNSQVMLKGIENSGCLLVTAGHAEVLNRLHRPTQSGRKLLNKKTWVGHLENMQYFCTVGSNEDITNTDNLWLDSSTIQARRKNTGIDLTDLSSVLGTGDCIGSLVGNMVATNTKLQRIVSRCGCQFYYASFDDELEDGLEAVPASNTPAPSPSSKLRDNQSAWDPVNTFTLKHPVLEICINSAQYALILDIVSNVLLYTEPQKKEVSELEQRMGFYFQLSTPEDLKGTILRAQNTVRACLMRLNELRRALYNLNEIMKEKERMETPDAEIGELNAEKVELESEVMEMKANLNEFSTELRIMIGAYKDFMTDRVMLSPEKGRSGELMRVVEVFLNHVSWRLTQPDGQLQIVNANLMNLRYINETMTDSSGVHSVEVGNFNMTNLMPNSPYKNVITPRGERRVGKDIAVRVYCRVKSPVGGIGVKDHFEVNLCPLNVALTHRLYTLMMGYFFPGRAHEYVRESVEEYDGPAYGAIEQQQHGDKEVFHEDSLSQKPSRPTSLAISEVSLNDPLRSRMSSSSLDSPSLTSPHGGDKKSGRSRFYANLSETASRELDKMKERAAQTNNFVYVKIPEVPICFSYKGEKEKNLVMDVHNFRLTLPTLQYQNRTWTWLDLMMTVKKDYKNVLVGQVIKEKLHWKGGENKETKESVTQDKAKILFGDRQPTGRKKKKKSLLSKFGLKQKCDKTDAVSFSGVSVGDQASFGLEEERFVPLSRSSDEEESSGVVQ